MNKKLIYFVIAGLMLFSGCNKDDDENESDDTTISDKEIVVKMTIYSGGDRYTGVDLGLDGKWVEEKITGPNYNKNEYTLYLTDLNTLPFPKDLTVNWGDGTETSSTSHDYTTSGTYQIVLKCKELRSLYIKADITDIDISQAVDLEYLRIENKRGYRDLKALNVSRNKKLKVLDYSEVDVPFVDVSNNTQLMYLDCSDRWNTEEEYPNMDFSKHTALRYLDCSEGGIKSLNIKGCKELIYLFASDTDLSDEMVNKIYNDLPQGKTWKGGGDYDHIDYSSKVLIGYYDRNDGHKWHDTGDISIAKRKGWNQYENYY